MKASAAPVHGAHGHPGAGSGARAARTAEAGGSCPRCAARATTRVEGATAVVALVGNPNVGKSTVFNAVTGARQHVANWPGKTVQVARGRWSLPQGPVELVDLPGTASLVPRSPDEELTRDLLAPGPCRPDLVVLVADAAAPARSLYLLSQVLDAGVPVLVALTMCDVARSRGTDVDTDALARAAGVAVVPVVARTGDGVDALAAAVAGALDDPPAPRGTGIPARLARLAADGGDAGDAPVEDLALAEAEARFAWVHQVIAEAVPQTRARPTLSDRVDRVVTSTLLGPSVFLAAMWAVFALTTSVAAPLIDWMDGLVTGPVTSGATAALGALGLADGWVAGLVLDGLIAGVGTVLTFVPLMAIMFLLLTLLEDSGYLARAAFVADRLMRAVGLPGRAFLPLLVGFGCNVPAVSGARILPDSRHRLLTVLLVPFTSCSARLTVYVLVATVFFGSSAGTVVFALYVASLVLIVLVGLALRSTVLRGMPVEALVLELPPYRMPTLKVVGTGVWQRMRGFLKTASGIIVATVCAVWLLSSVSLTGAAFGEGPVEDSVYGAAARAASPVFAPAGFDDWHTTAALMTGFVAKEAVVASWAQSHAAEEPEDVSDPGDLGERLMADFTESSSGHPGPAAIAFLVFLLAYTPCMATVATQAVEIGWRWTLAGVGLQLVLAWTLAVAAFQVGRIFW